MIDAILLSIILLLLAVAILTLLSMHKDNRRQIEYNREAIKDLYNDFARYDKSLRQLEENPDLYVVKGLNLNGAPERKVER